MKASIGGFTVINGSELTYTVLRAGPNEDGSWTVNEVLDRNPFPENWGSGFVTDIATPTPAPGPHFGGTLRVVVPVRCGQSRPRLHGGLHGHYGLFSHLRNPAGMELQLRGKTQGGGELGP